MKKKQALDHKKYRLLILLGGIVLLAGGFIMANRQLQPTTYQAQKPAEEQTLLDGMWNYMPGVQKAEDGLLVQPLDYVLVEQDGAVVQKNPPINVAGTHLEHIKGDFAISADIDLQESSSATMQLYGNVPIVADEFRIERESIALSVTKDKMFVKIWNGKMQDPMAVREFSFPAQKTMQITVLRQGKQIYFRVNDKRVGDIVDPGIFVSGNVWFGLDAQNKAWKLTSLQAEKMKNGSFTTENGYRVNVTTTRDSLKALAQKRRDEFVIGSAMALTPLTTDKEYAQIALSEFNSMTPENDMKMINIQPQRGVYTFQKADALVEIARRNELTVHGHTLVFGEANPTWFNLLPVETATDKQVIKNIMIDHIQTVVTHFGNKVASWDVVNEPLADYDEFENGQLMRNHKWYQAMGESYIITALQTAHQANPDAQLFINEYGLEEDGERWAVMYSLLQRLKPQLEARNIPVDKVGVGFQSHIYERGDRINPETLRKHIRLLEQLGYKAQVSELDVYSDDGDPVQADQYVQVLQACLEEKNCVAWRVWILSDRYNIWKDEEGNIQFGKDGLYGVNMQPRPAKEALTKFLKQ